VCGEHIEEQQQISKAMGNYTLPNTFSPVVPQVENNTNNQASNPHVMGETKKQDSNNERQPGKSPWLHPFPLSTHEQPDQETPREQLLNKRGNQNSTKKLHKNKKVGRRHKLRGRKAERQQHPQSKNQETNEKRRQLEFKPQVIALHESKKQQKSDKNLESIAKINIRG
jgi:hypothetical protein